MYSWLFRICLNPQCYLYFVKHFFKKLQYLFPLKFNKNKLRMLKMGRIRICIFRCVISSQLLLLWFLEVVSMNTFLNDVVNIFCCKHLKCYFYGLILTFCVYLSPATNKLFMKVIKYALFSIFVCHKSWCINKEW